jgi:hypothetical protein
MAAADAVHSWRMRDVVAHVISYDDLDTRALRTLAAPSQFRPNQVNAAAMARYNPHGPEQLLALLTDHLRYQQNGSCPRCGPP